MRKRSLGDRVYDLASSLNIPQKTVSEVIYSYIGVCRQELFSGQEVRIFNLVSIIPEPLTTDYISTLAWHSKMVSESLGTSYVMVQAVIKGYLDSLRRDLIDGMTVNIRGLVILHPVNGKDGRKKVHSYKSVSINTDIEENGSIISARVHTCKLLKSGLGREVANAGGDT